MIRRLLASLTCLAVLLATMLAYHLLVVPQIDPALAGPGSLMADDTWTVTPSQHQLAFKRIFPPDAWQLQSPRTIESEYAILAFQEYEQREDELELRPCTIVFFAGDGSSGTRRPFILQSPEGAIVKSDGILQMGQASNGRFSSGRLLGSVLIHSPETAPGKGDSIRISTRNVQVDRQRIWTTNDVIFQLGPHHGRGRDLVINLMDVDSTHSSTTSERSTGQLDSLELIHLEELRLLATANPLDLDADLNAETATASPQSGIPVDVTCNGPFRFDFQQLQLTLEDNVELTIQQSGKQPDQLSCQRLKISFQRQGPPSQSASQSDPSPTVSMVSSLMPHTLVASGNPALMQSPSSQAMVRAEQLSYHFTDRNLVISDRQQALVVYRDNRIVAPSIAYQIPLGDDQLGQLHAEGAGRFERQLPDGDQLVASWQKHCHLQRHQQEHVLSVSGSASVSTSRDQKVQSDELHVWLERLPALSVEAEDQPEGPAGQPDGGTIRPTKIAAIGNVQLETPQLRGRTSRAEIWIRHFSQVEAAATSAAPRASNNLPALPGSDANAAASTSSRFDISGDLVRAQLIDYGDQPVVSDITIQGNVLVRQLKGDKTAVPALLIHGHSLQMQRTSNGLAAIQVQGNAEEGKPAWIAMQQLELSGPAIQLDQEKNRIWVEGAGELTMADKNAPQDEARRQRIRWQQRLDFDGSVAQLTGNVETRGHQQLAGGRSAELVVTSGELRFHLSRRLDFANPRSASPVQLAQLVFDKQVSLQNRTRDRDQRDISFDRFQIERLILNSETGKIEGSGAGWVHSVFRQQESMAPQSDPSQLSSLHVRFRDGLDGNFQQRIVRFLGQVHGVYGAVDNWDASLATPRPMGPRPEDIEVDCQQLTVADLALAGRRGIELEAVGNTHLKAQQHVARAHRLTYSQAKDILVLEGGREPARLWLGENRTPTPNAVARRISYQRSSGRVEVNGASELNLDRLPGTAPR